MVEVSFESLIDNCPSDEIIGNNLIRAYSKINNPNYKKIICSISGGADSDIVLDICAKCDIHKKIDYVWFDTGLEYQATKDHLRFLEQKYNIKIEPYKAIKPIPVTCKSYGQPFISKRVSDNMKRLQQHKFKWEDKPYEDLLREYCVWNDNKQDWRGCKGALRWWCNEWGTGSQMNISNNKWLREFLIQYPPDDFGIKISDVCCKYAKKDVVHKAIKSGGYDLNINGIRKAEGGQRSTTYKNCFDKNIGECDVYRPIFWYKNGTKEVYEQNYDVIHSQCYTEYGLKRTGCAGCPFGRDFEFELEVIKKHEPKLFSAVNSIFGKSYEYTRKYREFRKQMNNDAKKK